MLHEDTWFFMSGWKILIQSKPRQQELKICLSTCNFDNAPRRDYSTQYSVSLLEMQVVAWRERFETVVRNSLVLCTESFYELHSEKVIKEKIIPHSGLNPSELQVYFIFLYCLLHAISTVVLAHQTISSHVGVESFFDVAKMLISFKYCYCCTLLDATILSESLSKYDE